MKVCNLPIGPYHPSLKEPEFFQLFTHGNKIVDVKIRVGYNHKGLEKVVENKTWPQCLPLIERICGICSHVHATCFANGVEKLNKIKIPSRASFIRTLVFELERIHSHLLALGLQAESIGFETIFMHAWKERERIMQIFEALTGNRVTKAMNCIGGVRWDMNKEAADLINDHIPKLRAYAENLYDTFNSTLIRNRLEGKGALEKARAKELCVVGPVARASGLKKDIRKDLPYNAYPKLRFYLITEQGCDALARNLVRIRELIESCKMVEQLTNNIPDSPLTAIKLFTKSKEGTITSRVEAHRGEDLHYIIAQSAKPYRLRIRPPTHANLEALYDMLIGENVADAPAIILSIDPCFSCNDRIAIINEHGVKKRL